MISRWWGNAPMLGAVRTTIGIHDLDGIAHGCQRIAKFVREHGEELVLAPVRFHQFCVCPTQCRLRALALGNLLDHRAETDDFAHPVTHRIPAFVPIARDAGSQRRFATELVVFDGLPRLQNPADDFLHKGQY